MAEKMETIIEQKLSSIYRVPASVTEGVNLISSDALLEFENNAGYSPNALLRAHNLLEQRPKNTFKYIQMLQESLRMLLYMHFGYRQLTKMCLSEVARMEGQTGERGGRRWTPEEDEALIELASQDGQTTVALSRIFGRTPGAIQSRISYLVGVNRMSSKVAGRFVGTVNGEMVEAEIDGILSKGRSGKNA